MVRQPVDLIVVGWCRAHRAVATAKPIICVRSCRKTTFYCQILMGFALGSTHPTVKLDFFNSLAHCAPYDIIYGKIRLITNPPSPQTTAPVDWL
ncbi:MAG: hypothetical protein ACI8WB_001373 [Phenylobacterium sp.]|jgi:hypothetical protein